MLEIYIIRWHSFNFTNPFD